MSDESKPSGFPAPKAPATASAELKRMREMLDPQHGIPKMLLHKSAIASALEQSQRLADLATPGGAIARIIKEQRDRFAALGRIGATLQSPQIGSLFLPNDAIGRMLQEQQAQFAAIRRVGGSLNNQLQQIQGIADSLRPAKLVMGEVLAVQERRAAAMRRLVEDMRSPFESMRKLLPSHPQIGDAIKRWSASAMVEAVAEYVADHSVTDSYGQGDVDDQLVELSVALEELGTAHAEGGAGLTWEQWLAIVSFVFSVIIFWYQVRDSAAMEARLTGAISTRTDRIEASTQATEAKVDRLIASLERLTPRPPADQYVVAVETLRLRASPEGREIARVYANQVLTATGQRGQWLRVRYFDYRDARLVEGWCWKKHLERVVERPSNGLEEG